MAELLPQSSYSEKTNTNDTAASVFLRLKPIERPCRNYLVENAMLKVIPIENTATNCKDIVEKEFAFTEIFHNQATQLDVYNQSVHSSIQNGESCAILTYGTSGSGKTFTMFGTKTDAGIVQRAIAHIFNIDDDAICNMPTAKIDKGEVVIVPERSIQNELRLTAKFVREDTRDSNYDLEQKIRGEHVFTKPINSEQKKVFIWISLAEIYNENVHDLLTFGALRKNLKILFNDGNTYIQHLTSVHVTSAIASYDVINAGLAQMNYAPTKLNSNSNRSHCILIVHVIRFHSNSVSSATYKFCDLAGSERMAKCGTTNARLGETQQINKSLMHLHRCFDHLFQKQRTRSKDVVPYRESKLTMILQKSFAGEEKITTIVTMAPKIEFICENLQVLSFTSIARQIVYCPVKPKNEIEELRAENTLLRKRLQRLKLEFGRKEHILRIENESLVIPLKFYQCLDVLPSHDADDCTLTHEYVLASPQLIMVILNVQSEGETN